MCPTLRKSSHPRSRRRGQRKILPVVDVTVDGRAGAADAVLDGLPAKGRLPAANRAVRREQLVVGELSSRVPHLQTIDGAD